MKIVLQGKFYKMEDALDAAYEIAMNKLREDNPELMEQIDKEGMEDAYIARAVVDFNYVIGDNPDPVQITAEHSGVEEVLTMVFDVTEDKDEYAVPEVTLARTNDDAAGGKSEFTDTEKAIVDASKGFVEVQETVDTTGVDIAYELTSGRLRVIVFANGAIKYYQNDKLIQEAKTAVEDIPEAIKFFNDLCKED